MKIGILKYTCTCCSKKVQLDYFPDVRTFKGMKANEFFQKVFDSKLCITCYTDSKVKETAEKMMGIR